MTVPDRPQPVPDTRSEPWFDGARHHRLLIQRCDACGTVMAPYKPRCISCFTAAQGWVEASGRGVLYSYTVVHQVLHPTLAAHVPYNVALVDLAEGVRFTSTIVDLANEDLSIGMALQAAFEHWSPEIVLPVFRPAR